jgi:hypothetical protein
MKESWEFFRAFHKVQNKLSTLFPFKYPEIIAKIPSYFYLLMENIGSLASLDETSLVEVGNINKVSSFQTAYTI